MTTNGTTAIATAPPAPLGRAETDAQPFFSPADIDLIRRTIAKEANDAEFEYFLKIASLRRLNPLTNQIYLSIYNRHNADKRSSVVQTTIHGLRLIADRTGRYIPGRAATYQYNEQGDLMSATAYVMRYHPASQTWHEVSDTAYFAEYDKKESLWKSMPHVMLAKCAEALALRRAFPEDTSGLYTDDEIAPPASAATQVVNGHAKSAPAARMTPDQVKAAWTVQNDRAQVLGLADWQHTIPSGQKLAWYIDEVSRRDTLLQQAESEMIDDEPAENNDEKMPF